MHSEKGWIPYPEEIRETPLGGLEIEVHRPSAHHVVMGASGRVLQEVYPDELISEGIPLYKRKGGGGTVLLGPETLVVTVHAGVAHLYRNLAYFTAINASLISLFRTWQPADYYHRGISDIAVGNRKLVGSSIFRRRQYLLFQASILVSLDLPLMRRLLRHPPKEPDYRAGRDHGAFLTSLRQLGVALTHETMIKDLENSLPNLIRAALRPIDENKSPSTALKD